jgi:hypothetical protein
MSTLDIINKTLGSLLEGGCAQYGRINLKMSKII